MCAAPVACSCLSGRARVWKRCSSLRKDLSGLDGCWAVGGLEPHPPARNTIYAPYTYGSGQPCLFCMWNASHAAKHLFYVIKCLILPPLQLPIKSSFPAFPCHFILSDCQ